jgi:hypothetical protein
MSTPNEYAPLQPADNSSPWAQFLAELRAYVGSNLAASVVTAWSVFLFVGGLIFLVYFWSIGFIPEIDAKALVTFLAVSALTGGCLFIMMSFCMVAPGYYWSSVTRHVALLKSPLWFFLPMVGFIFSFVLSNVLIQTWWWVVPLLVTLIAPLPLLFPSGKVLEKLNWKHKPHENLVYTNVYIRSYRISLSPPTSPERLKRLGKTRFRQKWRAVGIFYVGFILSILFFLPAFLLTNRLVGADSSLSENRTLAIVTLLLTLLDILAINAFVIKRLYAKQSHLKEILQCLIVGGIALFIILLLLHALPVIPKSVMHLYKLGNLPNASLVLDEIGCTIVQQHKLKTTPYTPDSPPPSPPKPSCSLSPVMIRSRLGNSYYIEASRGNDNLVLFTIPGQNVLSWAVNEPTKASTTGAPTSPQHPAPAAETPQPQAAIGPTR